MAFLRINDVSPAVKRPFRISDLQAIWEGIKSLFSPIKGQDFRIVSGFNLDSSGYGYSSGVVYYNEALYEYNANDLPITTETSTVYFAKIAVDTRQFDDGNSYPFAYKFVCGGASFAAREGYVEEIVSTSFVPQIPSLKLYGEPTAPLIDVRYPIFELPSSLSTPTPLGDLIENGVLRGVSYNSDTQVTAYLNTVVNSPLPSVLYLYIRVLGSSSGLCTIQLSDETGINRVFDVIQLSKGAGSYLATLVKYKSAQREAYICSSVENLGVPLE